MKTKNIITASILLVVAIVIGSLVATYFSYNNREIALRQQAEAQRGKIEGVHDKMWKIIQQKAQVTDEYKQTFEKIYPQLIAGRYQNDKGTMMKWIKESNPNFDVSLYRDLMQAIEIQAPSFRPLRNVCLTLSANTKRLLAPTLPDGLCQIPCLSSIRLFRRRAPRK